MLLGLASVAGQRTRCAEQADYDDLYAQVMHGIGVCDYGVGCTPMCMEAQKDLRDHECFGDYLALHSYMCGSVARVGRRCEIDLSASCEDPSESPQLPRCRARPWPADGARAPFLFALIRAQYMSVPLAVCPAATHTGCARVAAHIWPLVEEPAGSVTLVGAFPGRERFVRLSVQRGVGTKLVGDSPCEMKSGENLLSFAGTGTYSMPTETERQMDPEPAFYFSTMGTGGSHLHEMKSDSSVTWMVPDTFKLIQLDGDNVDIVYGITHQGCLGSIHGMVDDEASFSLCKFQKSTGTVSTVASWPRQYSYDCMDENAAFNSQERQYALFVYNSELDIDQLCFVNVETETYTLHEIPPQAVGEVESMHYDRTDDAILVTVIPRDEPDKQLMFHVEAESGRFASVDPNNPNPPVQYVWRQRNSFQLDPRADQRFTLISAFDSGSTDLGDRSTYYSVAFENSRRQYDILKNTIIPSLDEATQASTETTYLVMANVKMVLSHLYVDIPYEPGIGKDGINTPSVIYMGEFERLTSPGVPIEIELHVDDLDTPDLVNDIHLSILSSDPQILPQDEFMNVQPGEGPGEDGWPRNCRYMCIKMVTPNRRIIKLKPRSGVTG